MWPTGKYSRLIFQSMPQEHDLPLILLITKVVFAFNSNMGERMKDGPISATLHFEEGRSGTVYFMYRNSRFCSLYYYPKGNGLKFLYGGEFKDDSPDVILSIVRQALLQTQAAIWKEEKKKTEDMSHYCFQLP